MPAPSPKTPSLSPSRSIAFHLASLLLVVALACAAMLAYSHMRGVALPGCGAGSACDAAARSPWSKVPGLNYPVAFVGLAYAAALLAAWIASRGVLSRLACLLVLLGALASLTFLVVSFALRILCPYCLAYHACNLVVAAIAWRRARAVRHSAPGHAVLALIIFTVVAGAGYVAWSGAATRAARRAEKDLEASTRALTQPAPGVPSVSAAIAGGDRFEGRYRRGPEFARVRIVMFTDYQCPDCRIIERELDGLLRAHPDVAASIKYFPLSTLCNDRIQVDMHPDACWGARTAEVAGTLGGAEGFWRMHAWLFEKSGSFDEPTLRAALPGLGFDPARFIGMLEDPAVNARIQADIAEGASMGISNTPFIFINGVELRGWIAPKALTRAVEAALATNPPPRSAAEDHPPRAAEKYIEDWRQDRSPPIPPGALRYVLGPVEAPAQVVVIGDRFEPGTAAMDQRFRAIAIEPGSRVRYSFVSFPFDQGCNPHVPSTKFAGSCAASRYVEAVGQAAGNDAYWRVHAYAVDHPKEWQEMCARGSTIGELADAMGIHGLTWLDALDHPRTSQAMADDVALAKEMGMTAMPMVIVKGRAVRQWRTNDADLLPRILEEAVGSAPPAPGGGGK